MTAGALVVLGTTALPQDFGYRSKEIDGKFRAGETEHRYFLRAAPVSSVDLSVSSSAKTEWAEGVVRLPSAKAKSRCVEECDDEQCEAFCIGKVLSVTRENGTFDLRYHLTVGVLCEDQSLCEIEIARE
jgi:hypothetical protein